MRAMLYRHWRMKMLRKVGFQYALLLTLLSFGFACQAKPISFEHQGDTLYGHYLAPESREEPKAVLIFVHGDGAATYDLEGYYDLIWNRLRAEGYGVLSWNKPGVGKSTGNWLSQSMKDRQSEVMSAIEWVKGSLAVPRAQIGLIGFSQAGWVVPAIAVEEYIGFAVGIGFATNWLEQGRYYTETSLYLAGKSEAERRVALQQNDAYVDYLKTMPIYEDYVEKSDSGMSSDRYQFVLRNFQVDASHALEAVTVPTLLMWGDSDLNVDANTEFARWSSSSNPHISTQLISNGSHGMLDATMFDKQVFSMADWLRLAWLDEKAFAADFMPSLIRWLNEVSQ